MNDKDIELIRIMYKGQRRVAILFLGIVCFLYYKFQNTVPDLGSQDSVFKLSLFFIVIVTAEYIMANVQFKKILKKEPLPTTPDEVSSRLKSAYFIRIAIMSGVNFLSAGLVSYGLVKGVVQANPLYWLVLLPIFFMFYALQVWNPEKSKGETFFHEY